MSFHLEQFERAKRYLERLSKIYEGTYFPGSSEHYRDEVVSFFIHCYHIRDWIISLSKIELPRSRVDAFINAHEELKICADLCNGEKHCSLERSTRTGNKPHIAYREYRVTHYTQESGVPSSYKASYKIMSGNKIYDALETAEICISLWEQFLAGLQVQYMEQSDLI